MEHKREGVPGLSALPIRIDNRDINQARGLRRRRAFQLSAAYELCVGCGEPIKADPGAALKVGSDDGYHRAAMRRTGGGGDRTDRRRRRRGFGEGRVTRASAGGER